MNDGRASFGRRGAAAAAAATAGYFTFAMRFSAQVQLSAAESGIRLHEAPGILLDIVGGGVGYALFGFLLFIGLIYWLIAWFVALAVEALLTRHGVRRLLPTVAIGAVVGVVVGTLLVPAGALSDMPLHSLVGALSGAAAAAASWAVIHPRTRSDNPRHSASQPPAQPT